VFKPARPRPFRITSMSTAGGTLSLTWEAVPGTTYVVQRSASVTSPMWSVESEPLVTAGATLSWAQPIPANSPAAFYRIVIGD